MIKLEKGYYAVFATPLGFMGVMAGEKGLNRIILPQKSQKIVIDKLGEDFSALKEDGDNVDIKTFKNQINRYFSGEQLSFSGLRLDMSWATEFQAKVYNYLRKLPYGRLTTYKDVAYGIGNYKGTRAVGGALKRNLLLIIIPCHRVIASSGSLGGFTGAHLNIKKALIDLEQDYIKHEKRDT